MAALTKLRDACHARSAIAKKIFETEFTGVPECLSKDGNPYYGTKSQLLDFIITTSPEDREIYNSPGMCGLIVDLSELIVDSIQSILCKS